MPTLTHSSSLAPSSEVAANVINPVLTIEQIQALLPHRYPFLLVDRILESQPGKSAVGLKNVTINEPFFQGHFPGRPIMPGGFDCRGNGSSGRHCAAPDGRSEG